MATDHHHGHSAHVHHDVSQDKGAAYLGLFAGVLLLGALLYGMVTWTNSRYAHEHAESAPAAQGAH